MHSLLSPPLSSCFCLKKSKRDYLKSQGGWGAKEALLALWMNRGGQRGLVTIQMGLQMVFQVSRARQVHWEER